MTLTTPDVDDVAREIGALEVSASLRQSYKPHYNIAPTNEHPILTPERLLVGARWGLGERVQINIRKETFAHRKAGFVSCVVPVDGFFEWTGDRKHRKPIWFNRDRQLILFAGIVEPTNTGGVCFSIFTVAANAQLKHVHDRMPAILTKDEADAWLKETDVDRRKALLRPLGERLVETRVIDRVNSVKFDDPDCLTVAPSEPTQLDLI
jgi:putative SOS response-associated peptidase YedK